jgi:CheY-like chemotaxis protein/predicted regulator of Ras-like GTPase activity (Roadblock/LC7/MglB family)
MQNILIVDDEETVRVTLSEWFSTNYGPGKYKTFTAANGIEAIKVLAANPIDMLITDLNMPKMDGFELLAQMKNDYPRVPLIVISAFSTPDIKTKVVDLGALRFIPKPFSLEDLEEVDFPDILQPKKSEKGFVNGISLQSFLQLISMESKSCTLYIKANGNIGEMYLQNGELLNARTGRLEGGKAAYEIISWDDKNLTIEIDNECRNKERKIEFPIMHLLMESARMADERSARKSGEVADLSDTVQLKAPVQPVRTAQPVPRPEPVTRVEQKPQPPALKKDPLPQPPRPAAAPQPQAPPESGINLSKINLLKIQEKCKDFAALDGFAGAVLLTVKGDILQIVGSNGGKINLERASAYANSIFSTVQNSTRNMGLGLTGLIQVDTQGGHLIVVGRSKINLMLVLATSSSLGLARVLANSAVDEICAEIGC